MREPPKIPDASIVEALETEYGLSIRALTFLPLGADSASAAFRVLAADGATFFLKIRTGDGFSPPSLVVPRYLHDRGVANILSPIPTIEGSLWIMVKDHALSLYPFIEGRMAAHVGLSEQHWTDFGATLRQVHASRLTPDLRRLVRRETFTPSRRDVLEHLEAAITQQTRADPLQNELAELWRARREDIHRLLDCVDALGRRLRRSSLPVVLCHADLHN